MDAIRDSVASLSRQMKARTDDLFHLENTELWDFLQRLGRRQKIQTADRKQLNAVKAAGGLYCVDASYRRFGGAAPHYIELYQGLGLSSADAENTVRKTAAHSPLLHDAPQTDFSFAESRSKEAEARLAAIEIETAKELVEKTRGYALVMDGSLIRFQILVPKPWEELQSLCRKKHIPIIGVIEDIKTHSLGQALAAAGKTKYTHYDREILAGRLAKGEIYIPNKEISGKAERGLSTLFARFSTEPRVIGVDMDGEDEAELLFLTQVLYAITPVHGRGIPYLLDIIDKKARLEDARSAEMMKHSVDPDVWEAYFISNRDRRKL